MKSQRMELQHRQPVGTIGDSRHDYSNNISMPRQNTCRTRAHARRYQRSASIIDVDPERALLNVLGPILAQTLIACMEKTVSRTLLPPS